MAEWYCCKDRKNRLGPFSDQQLKALATSGELRPEHLVWKQGMPTWVKAGGVKGLFVSQAGDKAAKPASAPAGPPASNKSKRTIKDEGEHKKVFSGQDQDLGRLAGEVEAWFKRKGFEAQWAGEKGTYLIQAKKVSTLRTLLGNNQTIDVRLQGSSGGYSVEIGAGTWVKNLSDGGVLSAVGAVAALYTLGLTALQSWSERQGIEKGFWAAVVANCPQCHKLDALAKQERTIRCTKADGPAPDFFKGIKGIYVFTEDLLCKLCGHRIAGDDEKSRVVDVCPGCQSSWKLETAGETVVRSFKTGEPSPGVFEGCEVYTINYRCSDCSHRWSSPEKTRTVEVCPGCERAGGKEFMGKQVLKVVERLETRETLDFHSESPFGPPTGVTSREAAMPVQYTFYTESYRCKHCMHTWNTGRKVIRKEL